MPSHSLSDGSLFSSGIHSVSSSEWHTGSLRCSRAACFSSSRFSLSLALAAIPSSGCRQAMSPSRCFSRCVLQFLNSSPISPNHSSHTLKLYLILSLCETCGEQYFLVIAALLMANASTI